MMAIRITDNDIESLRVELAELDGVNVTNFFFRFDNDSHFVVLPIEKARQMLTSFDVLRTFEHPITIDIEPYVAK